MSVTSPPAATPQAPSEPSTWVGFWRRGLRNQVLNSVIAVLIWLVAPHTRGNLFTAWIYSTAIGTCCWFFIDGGRLLLAAKLPGREHMPAARRARWPGAFWMLACILLGTTLGYSLGSTIGDYFTGFDTPILLANRPAIAISLITAVAATWYFLATEKLRLQEAATEAARREATEAQLRLLQSQLEPHMLFNTLANLRVLITLDPPRAQAMLDRLIGFLRATLGASRSGLHPLSDEFDRLDDYLALMAVRMGPRLAFELNLPEALRALPVPPLLLQPLVENCIRHGLEPKVAGGRIEVRAKQVGSRLLLTVRDTGVGLGEAAALPANKPASEPGMQTGTPTSTPNDSQKSTQNSTHYGTRYGTHYGTHYGTQHVADRLATLYGANASFRLTAAGGDEGGTLAEVSLPMPSQP